MSLRYCCVFAACLIALGSRAALAESAIDPLFRTNNGRFAVKGQLLEELDLSNAQKQKIKKIYQQYSAQIAQQQKSLHSAQQQLSQMMVGTDSADAIRSQYQIVVQQRQALDQLRFESLLAIREILTPAQRRQFAQLMQRRDDR